MKKTILILIITTISIKVSATSQIGDILIWRGDTLTLFSNPLHKHPNWTELSVTVWMELEKEFERLGLSENDPGEEYEWFSTMCNRGYVAHWEIKDDSLFLTNIFARHNKQVKANLKDLFPEKHADGKVFAHWVSDELFVPKGKCIMYVHLKYLSVYKEETVLEFQNGMLINQRHYKNYIAKESQWDEDPNTYLDFIYKNINWQNLPDLNGRRITASVGIQPDENGQISHIIPNYTYLDQFDIDNPDDLIVSDPNNPFIKEAIRIAYLAPEWDVIFQRGKIISLGISISFSEDIKSKYAP